MAPKERLGILEVLDNLNAIVEASSLEEIEVTDNFNFIQHKPDEEAREFFWMRAGPNNLTMEAVRENFRAALKYLHDFYLKVKNEEERKRIVDGVNAIMVLVGEASSKLGRLTGKPGVALVTSGPGATNITTGLATANSEGDPLVAITGMVPMSVRQTKRVQQNIDTVNLFKYVTKSSIEILTPENIAESVDNAFRIATSPRSGAVCISIPSDIQEKIVTQVKADVVPLQPLNCANADLINKAASLINAAHHPVLLLGLDASRPENASAIRNLLEKTALPVVQTYEAAGTLSRELVSLFAGRVGLFKNQPGDQLIDHADLILTIGYDPVEYDPNLWNAKKKKKIIHLDAIMADIDRCYQPCLELIGDVRRSVMALSKKLHRRDKVSDVSFVKKLTNEMKKSQGKGAKLKGYPIHPLRFIHDLQSCIDDETTVISDVGSHYLWLARHLYCYNPRHLLFSNGQQTMGVSIPWAIATTLIRPKEKVISISGDGGFLFSVNELETAVRLKCNFVHCVWRDGSYNLVMEQQMKKYGHEFGCRFGNVDIVKLAESFGAKGFLIKNAAELIPTLKKALKMKGPILIDVPIDYSENYKLLADTYPTGRD